MVVDCALPAGSRIPMVEYPPTKFYRFAAAAWSAGIEEHVYEGSVVKIYSMAKTIADCFKFRNRIGIDVGRKALITAITEKSVSPIDIMRYAKLCRVSRIVQPILETIA